MPQGMGYYSDRSICRRLSMNGKTLAYVRQKLINIGLFACQEPLYQVLPLDTPKQKKDNIKDQPHTPIFI